MITIKIVVVALPLQLLQLETGISSLDLSKMEYHVQGVKFATGSLQYAVECIFSDSRGGTSYWSMYNDLPLEWQC